MDLQTASVKDGFLKEAQSIFCKAAGIPLSTLAAAGEIPAKAVIPGIKKILTTPELAARTSPEGRNIAADMLKAWRSVNKGHTFRGNDLKDIRLSNASRAADVDINVAMGKKIHADSTDPRSAVKRILARAQSGDGQLWRANNPDSLKENLTPHENLWAAWRAEHPELTQTNVVDKNYENLGRTVRNRQNVAKKIGYGAVGAAGAGTVAYGMGMGKGQSHEDKYLGAVGNKYISTLPLHKRLQLALGTVFRPKSTGKQVQEVLD